MLRSFVGDTFFGDNHSFNETLFGEVSIWSLSVHITKYSILLSQLVEFSNKFGGGKYNLTVAAEYRFYRIQQSIATNPNFSFVSPRFFTAYAESVFPINFFVDGRRSDKQLDLGVARSFFQDMQMPDDFHRASQPIGADGLDLVAAAHPIPPGANVGGVDNYVSDPTSANFSTFCLLYENFVNKTIVGLYPQPTGALRRALNVNLNLFYDPIRDECNQVFPYGRD